MNTTTPHSQTDMDAVHAFMAMAKTPEQIVAHAGRLVGKREKRFYLTKIEMQSILETDVSTIVREHAEPEKGGGAPDDKQIFYMEVAYDGFIFTHSSESRWWGRFAPNTTA
ncbi:MAG: hypothetical protein WCV79_03710 [Candidatus Paceibacterota bacterium]